MYPGAVIVVTHDIDSDPIIGMLAYNTYESSALVITCAELICLEFPNEWLINALMLVLYLSTL